MDQEISLILESVLCGLSLIAACALWTRSHREAVHVPIALLFTLATLLTTINIVDTIVPSLEVLGSALSFGLIMFFWPLLWFYVEGITAESPWTFRRNHLLHLVPGMVCASVALIALSHDQTKQVVFGGESLESFNAFILTIALVALLLGLSWFVQTGFYVFISLKRLFRYRARLKDMFATTKEVEMTWLVVMTTALPLFWVFSVLDIFTIEWRFLPVLESVINLGLMLMLALWSFRQKPGFAQLYPKSQRTGQDMTLDLLTGADEKVSDNSDTTPSHVQTTKYTHSSLTPEKANQIAQRLEALMERERLFLDPNLSLPKLSARLKVSPNLLSQTLNETIGRSFFDYVNGQRVKEAMSHLSSGDKTILTIALKSGFNSKSAFYKAFKRETGITPKQYQLDRLDPNVRTVHSS